MPIISQPLLEKTGLPESGGLFRNHRMISRRFGGAASAALTCQPWAGQTQTVSNDYFQGGTALAQRIENLSGAVEICSITAQLQWFGPSDRTVHFEIWSTPEGAGTQYGGASTSVTVTSAGYFIPAFTSSLTFSSMPNPAGDFYIRMVDEGGVSNDAAWRIQSGGNAYDSTTYAAYAFGTNQTNYDFAFTLSRMQ